MSVDQPRSVKYGMSASDGQQFHANHFVVMQERALFKETRFQHAIRAGPGLRVALDVLSGQGAAPEPVTDELPISVTPAVTAEVPLDLRAALGLR